MTFATILHISRPRFWMYLAGPYLLGALFAGADLFDPSVIFVINFFYFLVIANIYLYGINDLFDRDTDALNPKKEGKEHLLQSKEISSLGWVLFSLLLISAVLIWFQPNPLTQQLFIAYILLASFYSAPPLRFKAKPIIDSLSNVLYAFPAFIAYATYTGEIVSWSVFLLALCWTAAMHLYSAIPDIEADKKATLMTSAIFFGEKISLVICSLLWGIFSFLVISSTWGYSLSFLSLVYPLLPLWVLFTKKDIEKVYWFFPYLNTGLGFIAFLSFFL